MKKIDIPWTLFNRKVDHSSTEQMAEKGRNVCIGKFVAESSYWLRVATHGESIDTLGLFVSREAALADEMGKCLLHFRATIYIVHHSWCCEKGYPVNDLFTFETPFLNRSPITGFPLDAPYSKHILSLLQLAAEFVEEAETLQYEVDVYPRDDYSTEPTGRQLRIKDLRQKTFGFDATQIYFFS